MRRPAGWSRHQRRRCPSESAVSATGTIATAGYAMRRSRCWRSSMRACSLQRRLLRFLEDAWKEPDDGIWEVRGPRRHFTHSKVMAWVAFDRGVQAVERFGRTGPVERWREVRSEIHREVLERGFDVELNSFTQSYGSKLVDASLLIIPLVGLLPADDPRMVGTVAA